MNNSNESQCLIFSHRGASLEATENTPWAFDRSLTYCIDGIETDVQLSRDGIPVLWHDRFLDKIARPNQRIDDFDFADLCRLHLPESFSRNKTNARIMGLEEFVHSYHARAQLLIEVKNRPWDQGTGRHELKMRHCMDLAKRFGSLNGVRGISISSFNLDSLAYAHDYSGECPLIYNSEELVGSDQIEDFFQNTTFIAGLCLPIENLNQTNVSTLRSLDKTIATYTCNKDEHISRALRFGVDILITDDPQRAITLRG